MLGVNYTITKHTFIKNLYLIEFENQFDMGMTLVMPQEFYESEKFKDTEFTLDQYMRWWVLEKRNKLFDYPNKILGYNMTSDAIYNIVKELDSGDFHIYNTYREVLNEIYTKCLNLNKKSSKFYLIACLKGDNKTKDHELAHALWFTDLKYRTEMLKLLEDLPSKLHKDLDTFLTQVSYHPSVFNDEKQAYMATGYPRFKKYQLPFNQIFLKYLEKYKTTSSIKKKVNSKQLGNKNKK